MPEGPEVRKITESLNRILKGKTLLKISWDSKLKPKSQKDIIRYSETMNNFPLNIEGVICKGKQIFFIFFDNVSNSRYYLNSTLGMSGTWRPEKQKHSNFWLSIGCCIKTVGINGTPLTINVIEKRIYYNDPRHFGNLRLLNQVEFEHKWNSIGNDLLTENITKEQWVLKARTKPKWQICKFLMEQSLFSGMGNYVKAETLYAARVRPDRLISDISDDVLDLIRIKAITIIRNSYRNGGVSIKDYVNVNGNKGKYNFLLKVYMKLTDSYGNPVHKNKYKDGRTSHWVPNILV